MNSKWWGKDSWHFDSIMNPILYEPTSVTWVVLKNSVMLTGKHLGCSLFSQSLLKRAANKGIFLQILRTFWENLFCKTSVNGFYYTYEQRLLNVSYVVIKLSGNQAIWILPQ